MPRLTSNIIKMPRPVRDNRRTQRRRNYNSRTPRQHAPFSQLQQHLYSERDTVPRQSEQVPQTKGPFHNAGFVYPPHARNVLNTNEISGPSVSTSGTSTILYATSAGLGLTKLFYASIPKRALKRNKIHASAGASASTSRSSHKAIDRHK